MKFMVTRIWAKSNVAKTALEAYLNFVAFCSLFSSVDAVNTLSLPTFNVNRTLS